jgi:DNA-binding CsgD family transcriptional regulator
VALLEIVEPPKYQQIAEKALHLNQLGLGNEAIARHLGVDGKTVAKALSWILDGS